MRGRFVFALLVVGLGLAGAVRRATAESSLIQVDMQLVLAVDISFSISPDEQDIQRRGYVAAFRDPAVIRAIMSGYRGRIAVTYLEWAGEDTQAQTLGWTLIYDATSAADFARKLEGVAITRKGRTSISKALILAIDLLRQSPFLAERHVVDISSDGFNNTGPRVDRVRDRLIYQGVTINGLPLMNGQTTDPDTRLETYFRDCVIGGTGAFVTPVTRWQDFADVLNKKLVLEISGPAFAPEETRIYLAAHDAPPTPGMDCLYGEKEDLKTYIQQLEDAVGKDRAPRWMPREQDWPMPE
ncbi:MAG: hypothetical protein COC12_00625 [Rhodobacteraceae bacterium]|nr:MAG: hypothetical protein COC12_00625 [Paracoccaceae bacterium]